MDFAAKRKSEIRVEAGRGPAQVFIEQSHLAGAEAEVDFGEVAVRPQESLRHIADRKQQVERLRTQTERGEDGVTALG